jgi:ParB family transcriptional regulator, chromosome partitioning protein
VSRRSGLGRGLAALIPPSAPDGSESAPDGSDPAAPPHAPPLDGTVTREEVDPPPSADGDASEDPAGDVAVDAADPEVTGSMEAVADATEEAVQHEREPLEDNQVYSGAPIEQQIEVAAAPGATPSTVPAPGPVAPVVDAAFRPAASAEPEPVPATGHVPSTAATLAEVAPGSIVPNPRQPREVFDPEEIAYLATSLADVGVLQPLVVRPLGDGRYELVAGERRLRAAVQAGLGTVPVVVRHTDDANLLKEALVENIHRVQLNPLEEGAAYQQLLEEFDVTQEELATRLGRSRPAISNAIRLLQLPSGVQRRVASGVLSAGHAKVLLALDDPAQQIRLADRIVAEGMSVRATEELVRLRLLDEPTSSPASRRRPTLAPALIELQDDLSDALAARVKISMGAKRGKLAIEFGSVDDLERIVSVIANGLEGAREVAPVPPASADGELPEPG